MKAIVNCVKIFSLLLVAGCGVKGDPLPPLEPVSIGRGQPSYGKVMNEVPLEEPPSEESDRKKKKRNEK